MIPSPSIQQVAFSVSGMGCNGCASTVAHTLKSLPGVQSATVDLASESAQVQFDSQSVSFEQMRDAVHEAGYELSLAELPN